MSSSKMKIKIKLKRSDVLGIILILVILGLLFSISIAGKKDLMDCCKKMVYEKGCEAEIEDFSCGEKTLGELAREKGYENAYYACGCITGLVDV